MSSNENFDLLKLFEYKPDNYPFLLESSSRGNKLNRNSILFFSPEIVLKKDRGDKKKFFNELNSIWLNEKLDQKLFIIMNTEFPFWRLVRLFGL